MDINMSLDVVPLKANILIDWKKAEIKNKIISRVNELNIPISQYKTDNEFLTLICNLIEYLTVKKDCINKKDLVILIYNELYGLTAEETETLKSNIDIIHLQKKIRKVSWWKLFKCGVFEYFKKK
jgi:hypothetical protein